MARHSFARALGFAVLAAALTQPVLITGAFAWGYAGSLVIYMLVLTPISLAVSAADLRTAVRVAVVSGLIAVLALCTVTRVETALLAAIAILAIGRSLLSERARPLARVLFAELALGVLAFWAFAALRDGQLFGEVLAVWAFWLVQSGFALVMHSAAQDQHDRVDPFDAARAAAERLMS
jgi:hypothetical protein